MVGTSEEGTGVDAAGVEGASKHPTCMASTKIALINPLQFKGWLLCVLMIIPSNLIFDYRSIPLSVSAQKAARLLKTSSDCASRSSCGNPRSASTCAATSSKACEAAFGARRLKSCKEYLIDSPPLHVEHSEPGCPMPAIVAEISFPSSSHHPS